MDKEHKLKVDALKEELDAVRYELTEKVAELDLIRCKHEREMQESEEKLRRLTDKIQQLEKVRHSFDMLHG